MILSGVTAQSSNAGCFEIVGGLVGLEDRRNVMLTHVEFCAVFFAALALNCGASMHGRSRYRSCNEAQPKCIERCSDEVDIDACRDACDEAKQACDFEHIYGQNWR